MVIEVRIVVPLGMRGGAVIDWEEHRRGFWVLGGLLYLDPGAGCEYRHMLKSNEQYTSDLYLYVRMHIK